MPAKLTPEMKQAFIKWIDKNPEAVFDLIAGPGLFEANYSDTWADVERLFDRGEHGQVNLDESNQHFAWDCFLDLRKLFFPAEVSA